MSMSLMVKVMETRVGSSARKMVLLKLADNASDQGECFPSYQNIADHCEVDRRTVIRHVKALEEAGFLTIQERKTPKGNTSNIFKININSLGKGSDKKSPPPSDTMSPPSDSLTPPPSDTMSPRTSHSIEPINEPKRIKADLIDKKFESFYSAYPVKKSKAQALKAFTKLNPDDLLLRRMIQALSTQIENRSQAMKARIWIPEWKHPSTWLNAKCWEDDLIEITQQQTARNINDLNHDDESWADLVNEVM